MNIVLAHGFLGFKKLLGVFDYFNGVTAFLEREFAAQSLKVLITEVNPVAAVAERGKQLGEQILRGFEFGALDRTAKTHLIAHSMGGLDARFCLSPANPANLGGEVASLSTIGTPHRGSPIADLLTGAVTGILPEILLSPIRDLGLGLRDLTAAGAEEFNRQYLDHPAVRYFSYAGRGRSEGRATSLPLLPTHQFIRLRTGEENDGLVSVASAAWGPEFVEVWPCDHVDEVGHDLDRAGLATPAPSHLARYWAIVQRVMD